MVVSIANFVALSLSTNFTSFELMQSLMGDLCLPFRLFYSKRWQTRGPRVPLQKVITPINGSIVSSNKRETWGTHFPKVVWTKKWVGIMKIKSWRGIIYSLEYGKHHHCYWSWDGSTLFRTSTLDGQVGLLRNHYVHMYDENPFDNIVV